MNKYGTLYIVAAPSGAGKTSLVNALVAGDDALKVSISYTTRPPRPGEQDGVQYHFVTEDTFAHMVKEQLFLEYAEVFGYHYGTSRQWIADRLEQQQDVILEIDWQGARQVGQIFHHVKPIFILPPSLEVLRERLESRKQDSLTVIEARMCQAIDEMSHYNEFEYLVVNDHFDQALADLQAIVKSERLKRRYQQHNLVSLLQQLVS